MRRLLLSRTSGFLALSLALSLFSVGCSESDLGTGPDTPDLLAHRTSSPPGHTIRDAIRAQERHTAALMRTKGVVGTGVGLDADGTPVVRIFTSERGVPGLPGRLDDIPVEVRNTGLFVAGTTARARPAPVGYSVGHPAITAGTHGGVVKNGTGDTFILSNNHVLANSNDANIGDAILQPGPFDGGQDPADRIGTLADFEPIDFSGAFNKLDAAIAAVAPGDVDPSTPADGYGVINSVPFPLDGDGDGAVDGSLLGLDVQKYGRTTQLTTGQVTEINVTANVCYELLFGLICIKSANFEDLLGFPGMSQGGDSGSSIVTTDGTNRAVGLLFAGSATSTLASRIDLVLQRFGVAYDDGSGGGNQPPTASFTHACTDLDCSFDGSGSTDDGSITLYEWDFGDGNGATGVSPSHTYAAAGDYDVTLTVTDDGGLQDTDTQTVTATDPGGNQPPTASFTHACTDLDCSFDGSGSTDDGSIALYEWDFGDGNGATGVSPSHTYAAAGDYDVTLTVTDDGGLQDTDTQTVTATDPPSGSPTLTRTAAYKEKGRHVVELAWSNVPWPQIYVFRGVDGSTVLVEILAGAPTGTYTDFTGGKGKATYTHFMCEGQGAFDQCTNPVFTTF